MNPDDDDVAHLFRRHAQDHQAVRVLREHRAALDAVMRQLLEREVVEGAAAC